MKNHNKIANTFNDVMIFETDYKFIERPYQCGKFFVKKEIKKRGKKEKIKIKIKRILDDKVGR